MQYFIDWLKFLFMYLYSVFDDFVTFVSYKHFAYVKRIWIWKKQHKKSKNKQNVISWCGGLVCIYINAYRSTQKQYFSGLMGLWTSMSVEIPHFFCCQSASSQSK